MHLFCRCLQGVVSVARKVNTGFKEADEVHYCNGAFKFAAVNTACKINGRHVVLASFICVAIKVLAAEGA
jgi:hypothetical protein